MPVSVDYVYKEVQRLANKSQVGGFLSPDEYNGYAKMAARELVEEQCKKVQSPQDVTEMLLPFIKLKPVQADTFGYIQYPSDYTHFLALTVWQQPDPDCEDPADYKTLPQVPVKMLDADKIALRLSSDLNPPSLQYPIAEFFARGIRIYPITNALLRYIREPATPFWNSAPDANGIAQYTAAGSTDFDYDVKATNILIYKILRYLGIEIRDSEIYQASVADEPRQ